MRKGCLIIFAAVLVVLAIAAFFVFSTPTSTEPVVLASQERLAMLRYVPASVPDVVVIPSAAPVYRMLKRHEIAKSWINEFERTQQVRFLPVLLGDCDVVAWKEGRRWNAIANPDPLRRLFARVYLYFSGSREIAVRDGFLFIGDTRQGGASTVLPIATSLRGHAFMIHRAASKFPPIGRPAVSFLQIAGDDLRLHSRAAVAPRLPGRLQITSYPAQAMLATSAAVSPEWIARLERLFPADVSTLVERGALLCLYRVSEGEILPRLYGVIVLPQRDPRELDTILDSIRIGPFGALESGRRMVGSTEVVTRRGLGYTVEHALHQGNLVIAFDRSSIERFLRDTLRPAPVDPARTVWFVQIKPELLADAVNQLRESQELSLLAPDVHDTIRDTAVWLRYVRGASSVFMARVVEGGEEAFVVNVSK